MSYLPQMVDPASLEGFLQHHPLVHHYDDDRHFREFFGPKKLFI